MDGTIQDQTAQTEHRGSGARDDQGHPPAPGGFALRGYARMLFTQPWPLRLALGLALAQVVASALVIALGGLPQPSMVAYLDAQNHPVTMPVAAFLCAFVFWIVGWSILLAGAIHGHWALRLIVLAVFTLCVGESLVHQAIALTWELPMLGVWLWAALVTVLNWGGRSREGVGRRVPLPLTWAVVLALFMVHYLALWIFFATGPAAYQSDFAAYLVTDESAGLAQLFVFVIFLAGASYVGWGRAATAAVLRVARGGGRKVGHVVILPLLALLGVALLGVGMWLSDPFGSGRTLLDGMLSSGLNVGLMVLAGAAIYGLVRLVARRTTLAMRVPPLALILAAMLGMGALTLPGVVDIAYQEVNFALGQPGFTPSNLAVYTHAAGTFSPEFSLVYARDWQVQSSEPTSADDTYLANFQVDTNPGLDANVVEAPRTLLTDLGVTSEEFASQVVVPAVTTCAPQCAPTLSATPPKASTLVAGWQTASVNLSTPAGAEPLTGAVWWRTQGDHVWVIEAVDPSADFASTQPYFTQMVASWRPNLGAKPVAPNALVGAIWAVTTVDGLPTEILLGLIPLVFGLGCGLALLLWGRRRAVVVTGVFLVVVGVRAALYFLDRLSADLGVPAHIGLPALGGHSLVFSVPALPGSALDLAAGVVTLVVVGLAVARRQVRRPHVLPLLVMLDLSLLVLFGVGMAFTVLDAVSTFNVVQAVLLLLAFLWSLLTSQALFAQDDPTEPRAARGLISIGYSVLATVILVFATLLPPSANDFSLGPMGIAGLGFLGESLAVTLFLLGLAEAWGGPVRLGAGEPIAGAVPVASSPVAR